MCGIIAGNLTVTHEQINSSVQSLAQRGPDAQRSVVLPNGVFIAHTLLSIHSADVESSTQPLVSHDRSLYCCVNGEIYNYKELRQYLEGVGYTFYTSSDCEVVLHGIHHRGPSFIERLDGEFGVVAYDANNNCWICATDRFGTKPLKYYHNAGSFVVASTIRALVELGVTATIDHNSSLHCMANHVLPYGRTVFSGISTVPPATILTVSGGVAQSRVYYRSTPPPKFGLHSIESTEEHLIRAIRKRQHRERCAVTLSGGIDSAAIAYYMRDSGLDFQAYSLIFPGSEYNEEADILDYCSRHGIQNTYYKIDNRMLLESFKDSIINCETMVLNTHCAAKLILNLLIPERVIYSGHGGDEQFHGYPHFHQGVDAFVTNSHNTGKNFLGLLHDDYTDTLGTLLSHRPHCDEADTVELYKKLWLHQYGLQILGDSQSGNVAREYRYPFLDYELDDHLGKIRNLLELNAPGKRILRKIVERWDPVMAAMPKRPFISPVINATWLPLILGYIEEALPETLDRDRVLAYVNQLNSDTMPNRIIISQILSLCILAKEFR